MNARTVSRPRSPRWQPLGLCLLGIVAIGCRNPEPTPTDQLPRRQQPAQPSPAFQPVKGAEGSLREATLFVQPLEQGGRLEIRTMAVGPDSSIVFRPEHEVALELRNGELVTVIGTKRVSRVPGEMWLVPAGAPIRIWATGQLAGVRAIYLVKGP